MSDSQAFGKRDALAWLAAATGVSALAPRLRTGPARALAILAYHRIYDMGPEDDFPYDPELVSATPADFCWQMRTLSRRFTPIHISEAARLMARGLPLPPRAVAVTFDDGHRDNYTHAFPILREAGVPATIFLATGYLDRPGTFWFDEVAHLLYSTRRGALELPGMGIRLMLGDVASRRAAAAHVLGVLKVVPDAKRREALVELRVATGVEPLPGDRSATLTWSQVREMRAGGVEFGSHTVDHPILSRLDADGLESELAESRREIIARLGIEADLLAYPVGGESAYDERVVTAARACGYRMALTYVSGVNPWPPADPYRLRRLHVERYTTRARFAAMLAFPAIFA